jgi:hypothetical protein
MMHTAIYWDNGQFDWTIEYNVLFVIIRKNLIEAEQNGVLFRIQISYIIT